MTAHADLVITGANVYRGPGEVEPADSIAVAGDRIVAVTTSDRVREWVGPRTQVRHLPGRLVTPGFQDAHVHPPFGGRNRLTVFLNDIDGREEYLAHIRAYADANPDRSWIVGGGWSMEHFPGGTPCKEDLDAIVPDRPVFLFNRDVHSAWVNSRFLEVAGITAHTTDPLDGRIERDPVTGEPTGTLHEGAAYAANDRLVPLPTPDEWQRAILNAQALLHTYGITAWQDAWVTPDTQVAYRSLAESGQLTARVVGALWWERSAGLEQIDSLLERRAQSAPGFHPTTVKIMADGTLENYTGALLEPYCDGCGGHTDNSGISFVDPEILDAALIALDGLGFQVHMHAIGDRAVRNCLDAVAAARAVHGASNGRHHIAHLQVVHPQDVPRFAALGVVANAQPYWAQHDTQMDELTIPYLGPERAIGQYPFADLLRSGARMAMGSDWSVSTAHVLTEIEVAVTRVGTDHRDTTPFLPEQRLSVHDAIAGFTSGAAFVNHDEHESGRIDVGMRADLAVIDRDITREQQIGDAQVELTVASGRVVHDIAP